MDRLLRTNTLPVSLRSIRAGLTLLLGIGCAESNAPDRVSSLTVTNAPLTLLVGPGGGQSRQLVLRAETEGGRSVDASGAVWSSEHPDIVTVSATGTVTAVRVGTSDIEVTLDGVTATAAVSVASVPATSFALDRDSLQLTSSPVTRQRYQLVPELRDSTGAALTGLAVTWASSDTTVATVSVSGSVTANRAGTALIVAAHEALRDTVRVAVQRIDTLPDDADIAVLDARWTQGIQDATGSLPLIVGGRDAVLNVLLSSNVNLDEPSPVALRILDAGSAEVFRATKTPAVPANATFEFAAPTVQFLVPNSVLLPGRRWEVVRDPDGSLADSSSTNDRFPRAGATPLSLVSMAPIRLRFVPVVLESHGFVRGNITPTTLATYARNVQSMLPHGGVEAVIAPDYPTTLNWSTGGVAGGEGFWSALLSELDLLRTADGENADAYWIAVVAPPIGVSVTPPRASGTAWPSAAYVANDAAPGPLTRTSGVIHADYWAAGAQQFARQMVAHSIGHNFGRLHAPCGAMSVLDPTFPDPAGLVGAGAHDTWSWQTGSAFAALPPVGNSCDIMSFGFSVWTSAHTYAGMLAHDGATAASRAGAAVRATAPALVATQPSLVIRGELTGTSATLRPTLTRAVVASTVTPGSPYVVEGLSASGAVLFSRGFQLGRLDHSESTRPFAVHVPLAAFDETALETIVVRGPFGTVSQTYVR